MSAHTPAVRLLPLGLTTIGALSAALLTTGCNNTSGNASDGADVSTAANDAATALSGSALDAALKHGALTADGATVPAAHFADVDYVVFYGSAAWCGPCRRFTPTLVDFYESEGGGEDFEVVLISSDRSADDAAGYMSDYSMPWTMLPYDHGRSDAASEFRSGNGIPDLVVVRRDTGEVISTAFDGDDYRGPNAVLDDLRRELAMR